jgi:hypothetical protein
MHDNKLICLKCGKLRRVGKFGNLSKNIPSINERNGKNLYCRDCMSIYRKVYAKQNPKGVKRTKMAKKKYNRRNKRKISDYNKNYYQENKNRIMYNLKCKKDTECVMIFDDDLVKVKEEKINKNRKINTKKYKNIEINPQRK